MTTRSKNFDTNNYARAVDKLVEKTNKDLNLSNSDESYEEYTQRELEYIDKYKPIALYRMEDQELYEIITKHRFNDEKIENEIKEFVKLINIKGDDYGWTVIDEGKKKKLFINDKSSKKEPSNNYHNKGYENNYQTYDSYNNKKYNSWNKYNPKYKNSNYNKNYYNKKNYDNTQTYTEENPTNTEEIIIKEVTVDTTNEENNNIDSNNYRYKDNYYSTYNTYRGGRGKRGRGFNRGRYRNNNYSRDDWIFEKEFGNELKEVNGENTDNKEEKENQEDHADNKNAETNENNQEENQADEAPEDDFIEQETSAPQTQVENLTEVGSKTIQENKENVVVYETLKAEEIFENPALLNVKSKSDAIFTQNTEEVLEIVSQSNKDTFKTSSPVKESIKEDSNKKKNPYNSFSEIVSSNVQTFSFLGNPSNNSKQNPLESSVNSNNTNIKQQINQQEFSIPSHQMNNLGNNINNNKNENKFNLPNNNNFNQTQANMNGNYQDFYNAYQMQLSALLNQNVPAGLGPQQMYPMPLVYYPPGGAVGGASDPSINYGNFMPYMGYPMGYYINPQQMTQQQQSNLKDTNDMQNKNRKINNFDYNNQQQLLQNAPYSPYLYINSQYPMTNGVPMNGMNQGLGMNMMGYNFDQMSALNQMNMPSNYDPQNFNQKK